MVRRSVSVQSPASAASSGGEAEGSGSPALFTVKKRFLGLLVL